MDSCSVHFRSDIRSSPASRFITRAAISAAQCHSISVAARRASNPDTSKELREAQAIWRRPQCAGGQHPLLSACGSDNNTGATGSTGATGAGSTSNVECGGKSALKGSGSTAQANAMTRFVNAFEQACSGQTLNYTSNGSGAGVSEFIGNQTDIGGSDSPLSKDKGEYDRAKERCTSDAWNLPVVFGPLAVTYNVKGVDDLVLDGPTSAKIFNGAITTWDDPAIKALNEGASLPSEKINVIYRNDESGTTDNFQKYLDAASDGAWGKGAGKSFVGGVGEGAKGNGGHLRRHQEHRRRDHLQRVVLRQGSEPADRQDRDLRRSRTGRDHHRDRRQDHRRRHHQG